ncbi:hypothetical protein [Chryseobacterium sp. 'Rf worker isolate 10']|uniref:hypothetical protein n=1 Tax=Chryseobacterium sp. 'Rf worker isolate 10' TaxID=2887348 RepID=UPI003D6F6871
MHNFFTQLFAEISAAYNHPDFIHPDFQTIIDNHEALNQKLEAVFTAYMALAPAGKAQVQQAYSNNNNIEQVCNNTVRPVKFDELPAGIQDPLKALYGSKGTLYQMLTAKDNYEAVKNKCGSLKGHFEKFRGQNPISVCPFCGMENLMTEYEDGKNEYDHYLSKNDYPFCSINFNNLTPICDICNKPGYKGQKDIPFQPNTNPQIQDELYDPYSIAYPEHVIDLKINSTSTDLKDVDDWTLSIDCTPIGNVRKKDRWLEIYKIESRYKGKIAGDSYKWKDRIVSKYALRCKRKGIPFADFKEDILDDFATPLKWNNGILMKCFDEFIMNDLNCEANLSGTIF